MSPALDPLLVQMAGRLGTLQSELKEAHGLIAALRAELEAVRALSFDVLVNVSGTDIGVKYHIESDDGLIWAEIDRMSVGSHDLTGLLIDHLSASEIDKIERACLHAAKEDGDEARIASRIAQREAA